MEPRICEIWMSYVPQLAFKYPTLMHGVLCIAAQHMRPKYPSRARKCALLAAHHQDRALPVYIQTIRNITPENCLVMFPLATIWSLSSTYQLVIDPISDLNESPATLDTIIQLFVITKGIRNSMRNSYRDLTASPLKPLLMGSFLPRYFVAAPLPQLEHLFGRFSHDCKDMWTDAASLKPEQLGAFDEAVASLHRIYVDSHYLIIHDGVIT